MTRSTPRLLIALVAFAVIVGACSSDEPTETTTTTSVPETTTTTTVPETTTTTTVPETTTTTEPVVEIAATINGLPTDDDALVDRRLVAVKIDNHINARPQSGLESADAVYEVLVEGGLTRFIALFHQTDLDYVGPNRSGRVTDSKVMANLQPSPIQISGAQGWVQDIFRSDDINVVYDVGPTTYRVPHRSAPHNLFTSTLLIRDYADGRGWNDDNPGNLFTYGEPTETDGEATKIEISFSDVLPSTWAWDGEQYLRYHGNVAHEWVDEDGETGQIAFDTLVVMKMRKYIASNPAGSGTSLPTVDTVGSGDAIAFYNGEVVGGTWSRDSIDDPWKLTAADGSTLVLPAGRVWVSLVPNTETVAWE